MSKKSKAMSVASVLMTCILLAGILSGCSFKKPIDKMRDTIYEKGNYEVKMTMENVPLFGTISMTSQVDGNISYTPASSLESESYTEYVDSVKYNYTKDEAGNWTKKEDTETEQSTTNALQEILISDNFEEVPNSENQYRLKQGVVYEDMSDLVVTINEESYVVTGFTDFGDGDEESLFGSDMKVKTIIEFSRIGEIELTLPEIK